MKEYKTSLRMVFGDSPLVKVIDFLIDHQDFDYTKKEIAKYVGINLKTLNKIWPKLEKNGIVVQTRRIGRGVLYKLNKESPIVKNILELDRKLTEFLIQKETEKKEGVLA